MLVITYPQQCCESFLTLDDTLQLASGMLTWLLTGFNLRRELVEMSKLPACQKEYTVNMTSFAVLN